MVGLTLSDHVCRFAYLKISAFRSRKGQSGYREEWKWPNEIEDDPACRGHGKEARNSNIRSQLQNIWGKGPSSSGAVTSFQLPDQSVLVSGHLVWHNTIPSSKETITEIVSFAVFRRLCVRQEEHLGASQTWVEISPRRELGDTGRVLILQQCRKDQMMVYVKCPAWNWQLLLYICLLFFSFSFRDRTSWWKGPLGGFAVVFSWMTGPGKFNLGGISAS